MHDWATRIFGKALAAESASHVVDGTIEWTHIVGVMPRQQAPLQVVCSKHVVGTSSFGMSGINAHMLVRATSFTRTQVTYNVKSSSQG